MNNNGKGLTPREQRAMAKYLKGKGCGKSYMKDGKVIASASERK
jgi:hypothetical protein